MFTAQGINACFFQLRAKINQCDAQSLSNLVWAFATVLIQPGPLIKSIASASFGSLDSFAAQELLGNFGGCFFLKQSTSQDTYRTYKYHSTIQ